MQRLILAAAIACGTSLAAQTTHVAVGQQLGSVIQAAQPGDVILFSGTYAPFSLPILIQKPLFIHGKNGAKITLAVSFEVSKIPAGQRFVLQDVEVDKILVKDCDGPVLLAGIKTPTFYSGPKIEAVNCKDLTIEEFSGGNVTVTGCHVSIKNSTIQGSHYNSRVNPYGGQHGIWSINSTVLLGTTRAMAGAPQAGVRAGLSLDSTSHATISGDCTLQASQWWAGANGSAVAGNGTVVYNTAATFVPVGTAPGLDANLTTSTRRVPVTGISRSPIGGTTQVTLDGQNGAVYALFAGRPGPWLTLPGIDGEFALIDPLLLVSGFLPSPRLTITFQVPNAPVLRALPFRWQGATVVGSSIEWAQPAMDCHN